MKYLPRDVSSFELMVKENYLYVDKTKQIYELYVQKDRYHFLARPRRFGKSLLISTLKELFSGNKQLFKGLWIYNSNFAWQEHPVIQLDFSALSNETSQELKISLSWTLDALAKGYGLTLSAPTPSLKLKELIIALSARNTVVILIDEYDYPLLSNLDNSKIAYAEQKLLKNFFSTLKSLNAYIRAIFITGVSKFSKTSIFSGLNDLNDISEKPIAATLLGYTQVELETYFMPYIKSIVEQEQRTTSEILELIQKWYNGYRFSEEEVTVYNPFSVIYYLKDKKLANYWFLSGTPTFLIPLIKNQYKEIENIQSLELSKESLGAFDLEDIPLIPILYQTGYLTIADYHIKTDKFSLGYPNEEVRESLQKYLVAALARTSPVAVEGAAFRIKSALIENDVNAFCDVIKSLFANIPYNLHIAQESYYHSLIVFMSNLLGLEMHAEVATSKGRADLLLEANGHYFIVEFKFQKSAQQALEQIVDKCYYEKYLGQGKKITLIGISFDYKRKQLDLEWVAEDL